MKPDLIVMHRLLLHHYFPYHGRIDALLDPRTILAALDCHSMVPVGLPGAPDHGQKRPLICLGNSGDYEGLPKKGVLPTCPAPWIQDLAALFRETFSSPGSIAINHPYTGGFISNAHYWHKGIPWIQIEVNRSLYEAEGANPDRGSCVDPDLLEDLKKIIWDVIGEWCSRISQREDPLP